MEPGIRLPLTLPFPLFVLSCALKKGKNIYICSNITHFLGIDEQGTEVPPFKLFT